MRKSESLKSVFEGLPEIPPQFQASGQMSMLVSYHEGEVRGELHQNPQILSTLKGLRRFSIAAIFFCISVFPFFVRVHIFWLIIFQVVKVESTHFHKVLELSSVVFLEENLHAGQRLEKTIDVFSLIGMCVMVHSDPMVLSNDLDQIRSMEHNGALFALAN